MTDDEILKHLIPYRLRAVAAFNNAIRLRSAWSDAPPLAIFVDGKQIIEGNLNAYTNPVIEAGMVHCRALLEFLGLCVKQGKLSTGINRRPGDIGIERFRRANGSALKIELQPLLESYGQVPDAAESLLEIFRSTNKGLAHFTADFISEPDHGRLAEIASRWIPWLVVQNLYVPLGLEAPNFEIPSRPREA